jgi:hypothetical protein
MQTKETAMPASADHPGPADRRPVFLASLQRLEQWLTAEQIPYVVFGSVAAAAWIDHGASLEFDRPGARHPAERIPDIDLLVPRARLDQVKRYARAARHGALPVSIDTFWSECWIDYRPDSPLSYLTHRKIRIPAPTELLTPSTASLLGQQIAALDPRTLLHIYGTVGVTRQKDAPRIAALTQALASGALTSRFTAQDYQAFDTFMLARRRRYPLFFAAKRAWVTLTDALPPRASQLLTHHVQLRANGLYRMLSSRQDRRSRH